MKPCLTCFYITSTKHSVSRSVMSNSLRPCGLYVARQAPLSMGFSRQEYWSGLPCPSPGDLPKPGIKPRSPTLQIDSLPAEPQGKRKNTGVDSLSFSSGSSRPRSQTRFSCIAGGFFTNWAIREALLLYSQSWNQIVKVLQKYFDYFLFFAFPYTF